MRLKLWSHGTTVTSTPRLARHLIWLFLIPQSTATIFKLPPLLKTVGFYGNIKKSMVKTEQQYNLSNISLNEEHRRNCCAFRHLGHKNGPSYGNNTFYRRRVDNHSKEEQCSVPMCQLLEGTNFLQTHTVAQEVRIVSLREIL